MTAAVYLVPVLGALSGSPVLALSAGLLFGAVRGLAILLTATVRSPAQLRELHRRLAGWATHSLRVVLLLELLAALSFAAVIGVAATVAAAAAVVVVAVAGGRRVEVGRRSESAAADR